ncbi:hypothetical protein ACP4OV_018527 [Aristida adscensionis]
MGKRRRRQALARSRAIAPMGKRESSCCQQDGDGDTQAGKVKRDLIPELPEDIWCHIHSLMPLRDAACAACVSRAFLRSWRCHPNLIFNADMFRSKTHMYRGNYGDIVDRIIRKHSGAGVKILKLELFASIYSKNLDSWLEVAVTPGIEVLTFRLCRFRKKYNFPCSVLSSRVRNSIRNLEFDFCAFRPTADLGPLRSLTSLCLRYVRITGDELECFLSNSLALMQLELKKCKEIICLNIPCVLQQFSYLSVFCCRNLRVIESKAPNLKSLHISGNVKLSLGEALQMKNIWLDRSEVVCYSRVELPSILPNLETLYISSRGEVVNTPSMPTKFVYLKHLTICFILLGGPFSPSYDYFSLVSFLDASPSLETLILNVPQGQMQQESVFQHSSHFRQMTEHHHCHLKRVTITAFSSAKSLVELTCHILKSALSLECLTLVPIYGSRCSDGITMRCYTPDKSVLKEVPKAFAAIRKYIEGMVRPTVELTVVEPCSRCHGNEGCDAESTWNDTQECEIIDENLTQAPSQEDIFNMIKEMRGNAARLHLVLMV